MAVGQDQRGPLIGLRLAKGLQGLLRIGAHGDLRHVDVAVGDRLQRQILARDALARGGELGDRAERRRLRGLAAGVRIDLGVEHEDVDVAPARQDMVQPAVADVVGPAVAAHDPDAAPDQMIDHGQQIARGLIARRRAQQSGLELGDADALGADLGFLDSAARSGSP